MRNWNGKTPLRSEIDLVIDSDASLRGWGAACQEQRTGGPWSAQEGNMDINCLELLAATLAVQTFTKDRTGLSVLLRIDNTTAVAYINNLGGTVSRELLNLAKDLWMWCLERNIHITAQHLPGVMNHIADAESRTMRDRLDWKLNPVSYILEDRPDTGSSGSGSICVQTDNSVPSLFQLASGSLRSSLPAGLVAIEGLCQPPMVPNREGTSPGANPTSTDSPPGTSLEDSAMVPTPAVDGSGMPLPSQGGHGDHAQPMIQTCC